MGDTWSLRRGRKTRWHKKGETQTLGELVTGWTPNPKCSPSPLLQAQPYAHMHTL